MIDFFGLDDDDESAEGTVTYTLSVQVSYVNAKIQSAVFIKRGTVVEADKGFFGSATYHESQ